MKMTPKSFVGRLVVFPWFVVVTLTEFGSLWLGEHMLSLSGVSHKKRKRIEVFVDNKFPFKNGKKTNI